MSRTPRTRPPARRERGRQSRLVEPNRKPAGDGMLDVDRLADARIVVCCGSGGVGKTTTAAAVALRAAEQGRRVCVLTIDPARRLAQSMGLSELDNVPRPVAGVDENAGGSLDAMMLDMKRTFDEIVEAHASAEKAETLLANPFYQAVSSSFAGTQEYMAMEKLGQLYRATGDGDDRRWDLIVVDTPPSRSALDFLDAPDRLSTLLDGRFLRLMLAPTRGPARLLNAGLALVTSALTKVIGAEVLRDVQTFIAAFDTIFGGFRQRAEQTYALLQDEVTSFLVVAAPETDPVREASYFVERLTAEHMPLAGLVVNRVHGRDGEEISEADAASVGGRLREAHDPVARQCAELLAVHAAQERLAARERSCIQRFSKAHPQVPVVAVPALAGDVHDLDGLRTIGRSLAGDTGTESGGTGSGDAGLTDRDVAGADEAAG